MKKRGRKPIEGVDHRTSFLTSVKRTLDVLQLLSKNYSIGITELSNMLRISNSSAHRILATMKTKGFVTQDAKTGQYSAGNAFFQLTNLASNFRIPIKNLRPYLREIVQETRENAIFATLNPAKDRVLILAEELAGRPVITSSILFRSFPLHLTASGKAYLLTLNNEELRTLLNDYNMQGIAKSTPFHFSRLKEQLEHFRKLEYALSKDESRPNASGLAAGIYDDQGKFIGAVAIMGPTFRFTKRSIKNWAGIMIAKSKKIRLEFRAQGII